MTLGVMTNILIKLPLVHVSLPLQHLHLPHQPLAVVSQGPVVGLQVLSLDESLGTTILSVPTVLKSPPLLLQLDHVLARETMKSFVEFPHTQCDQLK